ncbi:uncharacterized protein MONOS_2030 [Monocercomonoides exilis]|uniref:uncharacterized protein n=1 Tax=Monocercomonoides exilis TaxID=2049356 RepID=UPI003559B125|nr:hypothetical protein MONOS_2030 [Monocercomonoides exilis]|eukprot:MONOS_2030.1-p1 / transcript=MONOS_2030.1 / gene=MONOS_2030 / organism=Monocercomonoides_exilis_PA203 / gene_product=unspecified product / transcript_product=unspecified product / location=Mono_scaffold00039:110618-114188(-) / protein_length=1136 / sequence_SO=supercontig / SO=protein_coding / is_pseudo=false
MPPKSKQSSNKLHPKKTDIRSKIAHRQKKKSKISKQAIITIVILSALTTYLVVSGIWNSSKKHSPKQRATIPRIQETSEANNTFEEFTAAAEGEQAFRMYWISEHLSQLEPNSARSIMAKMQAAIQLNDMSKAYELSQKLSNQLTNDPQFQQITAYLKSQIETRKNIHNEIDEYFNSLNDSFVLRKFEKIRPLSQDSIREIPSKNPLLKTNKLSSFLTDFRKIYQTNHNYQNSVLKNLPFVSQPLTSIYMPLPYSLKTKEDYSRMTDRIISNEFELRKEINKTGIMNPSLLPHCPIPTPDNWKLIAEKIIPEGTQPANAEIIKSSVKNMSSWVNSHNGEFVNVTNDEAIDSLFKASSSNLLKDVSARTSLSSVFQQQEYLIAHLAVNLAVAHGIILPVDGHQHERIIRSLLHISSVTREKQPFIFQQYTGIPSSLLAGSSTGNTAEGDASETSSKARQREMMKGVTVLEEVMENEMNIMQNMTTQRSEFKNGRKDRLQKKVTELKEKMDEQQLKAAASQLKEEFKHSEASQQRTEKKTQKETQNEEDEEQGFVSSASQISKEIFEKKNDAEADKQLTRGDLNALTEENIEVLFERVELDTHQKSAMERGNKPALITHPDKAMLIIIDYFNAIVDVVNLLAEEQNEQESSYPNSSDGIKKWKTRRNDRLLPVLDEEEAFSELSQNKTDSSSKTTCVDVIKTQNASQAFIMKCANERKEEKSKLAKSRVAVFAELHADPEKNSISDLVSQLLEKTVQYIDEIDSWWWTNSSSTIGKAQFTPSMLCAWFIDQFLSIEPFPSLNEPMAQILSSAILLHFHVLPLSLLDPTLPSHSSASGVTSTTSPYFFNTLAVAQSSSMSSLYPLYATIVGAQQRFFASVTSLSADVAFEGVNPANMTANQTDKGVVYTQTEEKNKTAPQNSDGADVVHRIWKTNNKMKKIARKTANKFTEKFKKEHPELNMSFFVSGEKRHFDADDMAKNEVYEEEGKGKKKKIVAHPEPSFISCLFPIRFFNEEEENDDNLSNGTKRYSTKDSFEIDETEPSVSVSCHPPLTLSTPPHSSIPSIFTLTFHIEPVAPSSETKLIVARVICDPSPFSKDKVEIAQPYFAFQSDKINDNEFYTRFEQWIEENLQNVFGK